MPAFSRDRQALIKAWRNIAVNLALGAMMLRALLPVGWMPAQSFANGTWLEVCDGMQHQGMAGMADMSGMAGGPGAAQDPAKKKPAAPGGDEVCPFAAAAHLATAGNTAHLSAPVRLVWRIVADYGESQRRPAPRLVAHGARAPPLQA